MKISEFCCDIDFHDSSIENINYFCTESKIVATVELCNWRQRSFREGDSEIILIDIVFSGVESYVANKPISIFKDFEILEASTLPNINGKCTEALRLVLFGGGDVELLTIIADDVAWDTTNNTTPGNFVSTSADKGIAQQFAGKNGYVYEINTSNYIDVNKTLGGNSPFPEQMEFSVPGGISPSQIKGAWTPTGGYIPNPGYIGR